MAGLWRGKVFLLLVCLLQVEAEECTKNHKCLPVSDCNIKDFNTFLYPCHKGLNLICCPEGSYDPSTTNVLDNRKTSEFPENCGVVITSDKISGGQNAELGQFPWMALLGYRGRQLNYTSFLCGGSVITEKYVLTAGHCIYVGNHLELVVVRLGELDILTEVDCVKIDTNTKICGDPVVDVPIQRVILHPKYDNNNLQNDIALIKVRQPIRFTDYIKPICLPFARGLERRNLALQKLTVSGWGKTDAANLGGSTTLQFTQVTVWDQQVCREAVPTNVRPLTDTQLCANGAKIEDACKGDSGGPLVNATLDADKELRYFQLGIVSFASTSTCGNPTLPTVYTRLDKFIPWIVDQVA